MRNPHGYMVVTGPDGTQEQDTARCVHHGGHFKVRPGSTDGRWCSSCDALVCNSAECVKPCERGAQNFMREIERAEARDRLCRNVGV